MIPEIKPIPIFQDLTHEVIELPNGVKIYLMSDPKLNIGTIYINYKGGRHIEPKRFTARLYTSLSTETKNQEFLGEADLLGASVKPGMDLDNVGLSLLFLDNYFEEIVKLLRKKLPHIYLDASVINAKKSKAKVGLVESMKQKDSLSYRIFTENLFGEENPYGYNTRLEDIESISAEHVLAYHETLFHKSEISVFVTGNIDNERIELLKDTFSIFPSNRKLDIIYHPVEIIKSETIVNTSTNSDSQSAIKIGRSRGALSESDFIDSYIANTLIGGYFGSSMVKNIREDKGMTYNIYSSFENYLYDSMFYISSELQSKNVENVIDLIEQELQSKCYDRISDEEIEDTRQYLLGYFLGMTDGTLNKMRLLQGLLSKSLEPEVLEKIYQKLINLKSEDINNIFSAHFKPEEMLRCVVK